VTLDSVLQRYGDEHRITSRIQPHPCVSSGRISTSLQAPSSQHLWKKISLPRQCEKRADTVGQPPFKVLGVLFLGELYLAFLPSKKAYWAHQFQYLGLANSIRAFLCQPSGVHNTLGGTSIAPESDVSIRHGSEGSVLMRPGSMRHVRAQVPSCRPLLYASGLRPLHSLRLEGTRSTLCYTPYPRRHAHVCSQSSPCLPRPY
jgi:hypothetical protein